MIATEQKRWYADWQRAEHARHFDGRAGLPAGILRRNFEAFNDVRLLSGRIDPALPTELLEVGCATGDFYRYLWLRFPRIRYTGLDVSRPAIDRAKGKYPSGRFLESDPALSLRENLERLEIRRPLPHLYSKDVIHHQTDPFGFIGQLLEVTGEDLIFRTRTRDAGATVLEPELSCQYHYEGWMPYFVLNLEEMVGEIRRAAPRAEIAVYRNRMVLGGKENRFLPKECYLPQTGTAETAVGVFLRTDRPGRVEVTDRQDMAPHYSPGERLLLFLRRRSRR